MVKKLIYTNDDCRGCNRCIAVCPVSQVNYSHVDSSGRSIIEVDADSCIHCGSCITECTHDAREYTDDTEKFLKDLKSGKKITVLVAPAFITNYPNEYRNVLGYLKSLGVPHIISVSFGADITTWAYLNYITKNEFYGGISQPCPAIVDYIEKYIPELVDKLVPVHSPMMCSAIYARKYMNLKEDFAFLSPCIAKKSEISRPENDGYIKYNVTFDHLMKKLKGMNLKGYDAGDEIEYGMGSIYPMPGGLKENVEYFVGRDVMIRQAEGPHHVYDFIKHYAGRVKGRKALPFMVDALNCQTGCIFGTATEHDKIDAETTILETHNQKLAAAKKKPLSPWNIKHSYKGRMRILNKAFSKLKLEGFMCTYSKSRSVLLPEPTEAKINDVFVNQMHKNTPADRAINCGACGYKGGCKAMAKAIAQGINHPGNCIYYIKAELEIEKEEIAQMSEHARQEHLSIKQSYENVFEDVDDINRAMAELNEGNQMTAAELEQLTGELNGLIEEMKKISNAVELVEAAVHGYDQINREVISVSEETGLLAINAGIEAARAGVEGKGFAVIAQQVKQLAGEIEETAGNGTKHSEEINAALRQLEHITQTVSKGTGKIGEKVATMASASHEISAQTQSIEDTAEKIKDEMLHVIDSTGSDI